MPGSKAAYTELLKELRELLLSSLNSAGVSLEIARSVADSTTNCLINTWGGSLIYFPKGRIENAKATREKIIENFKGNNVLEVARMCNVSIPHVYRVLGKAHAEKKVRN
jgi:Mor family transcriptional regulator